MTQPPHPFQGAGVRDIPDRHSPTPESTDSSPSLGQPTRSLLPAPVIFGLDTFDPADASYNMSRHPNLQGRALSVSTSSYVNSPTPSIQDSNDTINLRLTWPAAGEPQVMKTIQIRRSEPLGPALQAFCDEYDKTYGQDWYFGYLYSTPVLGDPDKHSLFDLKWETTPNNVNDEQYPKVRLEDGDIVYVVSPEHLKFYWEGRAKHEDAKPMETKNSFRPNAPNQEEVPAYQGPKPNFTINQLQSNHLRQRNASSQPQPNNLHARNSNRQSQSNKLPQGIPSRRSQPYNRRAGYPDYHCLWVNAVEENAALQAEVSKYRDENARLRNELNRFRGSSVQPIQPVEGFLGQSSIPTLDRGAYGPTDPGDKVTGADRTLLAKNN